MSRPPRVTVLLPARNAEPPVARAVTSLLEGTLHDLRVLAVGVRGIREEIRAPLTARDRVEGVHFTCAASGRGARRERPRLTNITGD